MSSWYISLKGFLKVGWVSTLVLRRVYSQLEASLFFLFFFLVASISKLNWYWQSKNENSFQEKNPIQSDDTCYLTFYRENPMIFFWKIISVLQVSTSAVCFLLHL